MPLTAHPLRVEKKLPHFSLREKENGWTDSHSLLCQVSTSPGCYPSNTRGCSNHPGARRQTSAGRNTNTQKQREAPFALGDKRRFMTDRETFSQYGPLLRMISCHSFAITPNSVHFLICDASGVISRHPDGEYLRGDFNQPPSYVIKWK